MKINLTKGIVTLTSETDEEAITLFQFSLTKSNNFDCEICGKHFTNDIGLRTHTSLGHKIRSKNYERNRRVYLRAKAKKAREAKKVEVTSSNPTSWLSPNVSL